MTEAVLAVFIPVGLMAGALALQRFEYRLLGPAQHGDDDERLRPARPPSRPSAAEESAPHL